MAEPDVLSTKKTFVVLVIVAGCFAVIWPRIISPLFADNVKEQIRPNKLDKATGCCDMFYDTDINAIRIMTEVCSSILEKQNENLDQRTKQAIQSGKLPKDIIAKCRKEVNATCGLDIATLLDQNIKLGKSYKQILDAVRSYNGSSCLKTHFGVSPWELGVSHYMSSGWVQDSLEYVKQERPPHLHTSAPHPAMRERGRTIMPGAVSDSRPSPPSAGPVPLRREGRPATVPGMRPPMGGAGHVVPAPKSTSVGFIMPVYTIAMVIFFFYTLCRLVFKKTGPESEVPYAAVQPDPTFRRRVFEDSSNRHSPETNRLGDEELDLLKARLAETERAMERIVEQLKGPLAGQETQSDSTHSHTNGSIKKSEKEHTPEKEQTPERILTQDYTSQYRISPERVEEQKSAAWDVHQKESSPPREYSPPPMEYSPPPMDYTLQHKEKSPQPKEPTPPPKEQTPEKEKVEEKGIVDEILKEHRLESEEEYSDEEISYEEDELPPENEAPLKPIRTSAEPEHKTVTVVGMELTAHCAGGRPWGARPATPPAPPPRPHTPAAEVSSIFLEGSLPHQSRLLVADSETHTQKQTTNGKDSPVILSGKMTLSVIDDDGKESPERVTEDTAEIGADDDLSEILANATAGEHNGEEELFDDWLEEVIEEEGEENQEAVVVAQSNEEISVSEPEDELHVPQQEDEVEQKNEVRKQQEDTIEEEQTEDKLNFPQPEKEVILPHPEEVEEKIQEEVVEEFEEKIQQEVAEESEEEDEESESEEDGERDSEDDEARGENYLKNVQIEKHPDINERHLIEEDQEDMSEEEIEEEVEEETEEEEEIEAPEDVEHQVQKNQEGRDQELEAELAEKRQQVKKEQEKIEQELQEEIESEKYQNVHREQEVEGEELENEEIDEGEVEEIEVSESESDEREVEPKLKVVSNDKKVNGTK